MMFSLAVFGAAAALTAAQIVGIGPQNAFVIRQGLARSHVPSIVALCIVCEFGLVSLGVLGVGQSLFALPGLVRLLTWGGAAFIFVLGLMSLRKALKPSAAGSLAGSVVRGRRAALRTVLVVTLLNPYAWLDTVLLIGSVSALYGKDGRLSFMVGSLLVSSLWFCLLGLLSGRFSAWFVRPGSMRALDGVIGGVMLLTAVSLVARFGVA
jgi:L-lysine exporter family protein LysE/ArgO